MTATDERPIVGRLVDLQTGETLAASRDSDAKANRAWTMRWQAGRRRRGASDVLWQPAERPEVDTYRCLLQHRAVFCAGQTVGKPKTKKCPGCGGAWLLSKAYIVVLPHTSTPGRRPGHYSVDDVGATVHPTLKSAEARIAADTTDTLVQRLLSPR